MPARARKPLGTFRDGVLDLHSLSLQPSVFVRVSTDEERVGSLKSCRLTCLYIAFRTDTHARSPV